MPRVTYAATDKPAVECLEDLSQMLGDVSWQLLYDVQTQSYVLERAPVLRQHAATHPAATRPAGSD